MEILDTWVENGFINAAQREAIAELIADEKDASYDVGYDNGYSSGDTYDDGYDAGWDEGYNAAKAELEEKMKNEWFEQGWAEALLEHGIEE